MAGDKDPSGLLKDGEVSSYLYRGCEKLDCLRSPHLYREHAVRKNVVTRETKKWFTPNALYTSCHDLISKILQFDCDGDKSLVCADPLIIQIAERNMKDIVPLYYEMAKAGAVIVTPEEIFHGLRAAWTGGNIGVISNDITKIWNSDDVDLDAIKILCMENNFCIDYAKTLYKPTRPDHINSRLSRITGMKAPHFFIYAKGKTAHQVQKKNDSVVNKLDKIIPNKRMSFAAKNIGVFHYQDMLSDPKKNVTIKQEVIDLYNAVEKEYRYSISFYDDNVNFSYIRDSILERFSALKIDCIECCNILVKYLFHMRQSKRKNVFWMCFGDIVLSNLKQNLPVGSIQCKKCGERFIPENGKQKLCSKCASYQPIIKKTICCIDCGAEFEVDGIVKNKKRCEVCQEARDKEKKAERNAKYYKSHKN